MVFPSSDRGTFAADVDAHLRVFRAHLRVGVDFAADLDAHLRVDVSFAAGPDAHVRVIDAHLRVRAEAARKHRRVTFAALFIIRKRPIL